MMKKILTPILIFVLLPIIVNAKNQTFDEFWKEIQKAKGDKTQLAQYCEDFLKNGDFKVTKEEFLANKIADEFVKWIPILTKGNKYSSKMKKEESTATTTTYKYGSGTNFENESNFYVLRIENKLEYIEICFGLRNGIFKIVGFSYRLKQ